MALIQKGSDDLPVEAGVLRGFALAQAQSWLYLCASWFSDEAHDPSLEDDLRRYVDPGVILPSSPERLFEFLDRLQASSELTADSRYVIEAVRASVCVAAGKPNASASQWAEHFFALEVACRLDGHNVPPRVRAMKISEERAQRTVGRKDAWKAVAHWVARVSDIVDDLEEFAERLQYLDEVATKAGHPSVVIEVMESRQQALLLSGDVPVSAFIERMRAMVARFRSSENILRLFRPEARGLHTPVLTLATDLPFGATSSFASLLERMDDRA